MINLDGRRFSPVSNSEHGRVTSNAVFEFFQTGNAFSASYKGPGLSDGHLIGTMDQNSCGDLVYHSRALDGSLEAGAALAVFVQTPDGITIDMNWRWLNGSTKSGKSHYREIL